MNAYIYLILTLNIHSHSQHTHTHQVTHMYVFIIYQFKMSYPNGEYEADAASLVPKRQSIGLSNTILIEWRENSIHTHTREHIREQYIPVHLDRVYRLFTFIISLIYIQKDSFFSIIRKTKRSVSGWCSYRHNVFFH